MDNQQQQQQHNHSRHLSLQQNDITNTTNTTNTTTTSNTTKNNARNNIKNSNINKTPLMSPPHHNEQSLNNNTNNTNSNNNNTNYPNYEQLYLPESNSTNNFFNKWIINHQILWIKIGPHICYHKQLLIWPIWIYQISPLPIVITTTTTTTIQVQTLLIIHHQLCKLFKINIMYMTIKKINNNNNIINI